MDVFSNVVVRQIALAMISAFVLGQGLSSLYVWTKRGQDYSRTFAQALVLGGIVGAMIMLAIGNSLARGVGIFGALALIRFRTNLRDPLEMIFIFAAFASGIACGAGTIAAGLIGTTVFAVVIVVSQIAGGSSAGGLEAELRVRMNDTPELEQKITDILKHSAQAFALLKRRAIAGTANREKENGTGTKLPEQRLVYRVILKDAAAEPGLSRTLSAVAGVSEVQVSLESVSAQAGSGGDDD